MQTDHTTTGEGAEAWASTAESMDSSSGKLLILGYFEGNGFETIQTLNIKQNARQTDVKYGDGLDERLSGGLDYRSGQKNFFFSHFSYTVG
jgi:hypothetical protein